MYTQRIHIATQHLLRLFSSNILNNFLSFWVGMVTNSLPIFSLSHLKLVCSPPSFPTNVISHWGLCKTPSLEVKLTWFPAILDPSYPALMLFSIIIPSSGITYVFICIMFVVCFPHSNVNSTKLGIVPWVYHLAGTHDWHEASIQEIFAEWISSFEYEILEMLFVNLSFWISGVMLQ